MKRRRRTIVSLDKLATLRRARRALDRVIRYLEAQERHERSRRPGRGATLLQNLHEDVHRTKRPNTAIADAVQMRPDDLSYIDQP